MRFLKAGEYDLVNISLLGYDPVTGRTYKECHDEWQAELDKTILRFNNLRWWNIIDRISVGLQFSILKQRLGM